MLKLEKEIEGRISHVLNYYGVDGRENKPDFELAAWAMDWTGAMGDESSIRDMIRETISRIKTE